MRKIVYYVAISLDGFIAGPNSDISGFTNSGNGVAKYLEDLLSFDTVIMGRHTYEFGYRYGLKPGDLPYPHMKHFIFSESMDSTIQNDNLKICSFDLKHIEALKEEEGSDIYCCGGGIFAGWLLENGFIDIIKVKLNPFILGRGIKLFENLTESKHLNLIKSEEYEGSLQMITYEVLQK